MIEKYYSWYNVVHVQYKRSTTTVKLLFLVLYVYNVVLYNVEKLLFSKLSYESTFMKVLYT